MELKEAILSTLAELQEDGGSIKDTVNTESAEQTQEEARMPNFDEPLPPPSPRKDSHAPSFLHNIPSELDANEVLGAMIKKEPPLMPMAQERVRVEEVTTRQESTSPSTDMDSDRKFLEGLRERILVMFEGMQSPNNRAPEAKIDLILNFFEWQLALIDERLEDKNR